MTAFELTAPARVVFGKGKAGEVPAAVKALGAQRALVVTGRSRARAAKLEEGLGAAGIATTWFPIEGEPTLEAVRQGTSLAVASACDSVVGFGGGSALDGAKAIAALATNGGDPLDYLEVIGRGAPLTKAPLPFVAVPTTAGTGSEVTRNAVLGSHDPPVKASLRSPRMLAHLAVVDPDLLEGTPRDVLVQSGLDALSQLIEPFLSVRANPMTDALAREGMRRSARSLRRAALHGTDEASREDLAVASLFGGLCLANAGLGAVHGFAAPAGAMFSAPHGAVCAALLAPVLDVNLRALRARQPESPVIDKFREVSVILTGNPGAQAEDAAHHVAELVATLGVPSLGHWGMTPGDVPTLVQRAIGASSMKANPVVLTEFELTEVARRVIP